jgi:C2 domain
MPSTVKVRVKAARNLPMGSGGSSSSDAVSPPSGKAATTTSSATQPISANVFGSSLLLGSNSGSTSQPLHSVLGRDWYVTVTLGGHSSNIAGSEEERAIRLRGSHNNNQASNQPANRNVYAGSSSAVPAATSSSYFHKPGYTARTNVCRRTLQPVWDEEFRFDVSDDSLLQDEPLVFKVCDLAENSTSSAMNRSNSSTGVFMSTSTQTDETSIGLVYIDLNPLLTSEAEMEMDDSDFEALDGVDGWFPLYDTLNGVRGELLLSVKLNFIGDVNPFRDSSAGVRLLPFSTLHPDAGYNIIHVFGFVEELVVADDPEYEWNESLVLRRGSSGGGSTRNSAPGATHENRQTLMHLLDASVRRRMCKRVLEMGVSRHALLVSELLESSNPFPVCRIR